MKISKIYITFLYKIQGLGLFFVRLILKLEVYQK